MFFIILAIYFELMGLLFLVFFFYAYLVLDSQTLPFITSIFNNIYFRALQEYVLRELLLV